VELGGGESEIGGEYKRSVAMKNVIIVAPQFPPSNLAAVHRCRYFAKHLLKFGWNVQVLTVEPRFYEEKLDNELERLLPPDLEVIRTKAFPARPLRLIGDISIRAFWWQYRALCRLIRQKKPDLIFISIPPNFLALLGPLIYRKFGIAYVIDYQDPWTRFWPGCERLFSKAWFSYQLSLILEPIVLRNVSLVTAVAPGYYEVALKRYAWFDQSKCLAMPIGAEEDDFRYLKEHPRSAYIYNTCDENFNFVYAGIMYPSACVTLEALLGGISVFKRKYPHVAGKLKFHFIGSGVNPSNSKGLSIEQMVKQSNLSDIVFEYPKRMPYLDVLNHLKAASAIFILGSSEAHYTPSKVFQAVVAQRPIFALLHSESTAVEIIKKINAGIVVTFDEAKRVGSCLEEIADAIYQTMTDNFSGEQVNWLAFKAYSAEAVTEKLAKVFDTVAKNNES